MEWIEGSWFDDDDDNDNNDDDGNAEDCLGQTMCVASQMVW